MPNATPQPSFVLIRPQMGENIGAAARAMWNFGLDRMRITSPRDGWPNQKAIAMSSGAGRLLDEAQIVDSTAAAVADCTYVYATTARPRELTKPVFTPEHAMKDAAQRIANGEQIAVLFGPERAGMENDDIAKANAIISVPVNPEFPDGQHGGCLGNPARDRKAGRTLRRPHAGSRFFLSKDQSREYENEPAQPVVPDAADPG